MAGERVLVVDDEEGIRELLQRTLEGAGYDVATAADGQEALDKISQLNVGVVLLDIKMPGMSGIDVLRKLTVDQPEIAIIMATAVVDTQTAVEAMKLGAYDYITKPFNRDDVVLTVQRAIERRELHAQKKKYQLELEQSVRNQAGRMQTQFLELVQSLSREHQLLFELEARRAKGEPSLVSKLPSELQKQMASVEEFRDALLRILKKGKA